MKTKFKTDEIAHIWANESAPRGDSPSAMHFSGNVIYSYGMDIARHCQTKDGMPYVVFNSEGRSNTTTTHQNLVRAAIPGRLTVFEYSGGTLPSPDQLLEFCLRKAAYWKKDAVSRRTGTAVKASAEQQVWHYLKQANAVSEFFGLKKQITEESIAEFEADKVKELKRADNLRKKQEKAAAKKEADDLAAWIAGEDVNRLFNSSPVALRREGEEVVTSRGASVSLKAAQRTFKFISGLKAKGWKRNGVTHQVGAYSLDEITEEEIIIGCHHIAWKEIGRFAKQQGWI